MSSNRAAIGAQTDSSILADIPSTGSQDDGSQEKADGDTATVGSRGEGDGQTGDGIAESGGSEILKDIKSEDGDKQEERERQEEDEDVAGRAPDPGSGSGMGFGEKQSRSRSASPARSLSLPPAPAESGNYDDDDGKDNAKDEKEFLKEARDEDDEDEDERSFFPSALDGLKLELKLKLNRHIEFARRNCALPIACVACILIGFLLNPIFYGIGSVMWMGPSTDNGNDSVMICAPDRPCNSFPRPLPRPHAALYESYAIPQHYRAPISLGLPLSAPLNNASSSLRIASQRLSQACDTSLSPTLPGYMYAALVDSTTPKPGIWLDQGSTYDWAEDLIDLWKSLDMKEEEEQGNASPEEGDHAGKGQFLQCRAAIAAALAWIQHAEELELGLWRTQSN